MNRSLAVAALGLALTACGGDREDGSNAHGRAARGEGTPAPLRIRGLHGSIVRMGTLRSRGRSEPLYGIRLRADVCARSRADADRTYPTRYRISHFVPRTRKQTRWGRPFRIVENELHWLVPFGETRDVCGDIEFEDVLPPATYGGVESPLGNPLRCYGVRLTIYAALVPANGAKATTATASKRTIVHCGRFRPS